MKNKSNAKNKSNVNRWNQRSKNEKAVNKEQEIIIEHIIKIVKDIMNKEKKPKIEDVLTDISNWIFKRRYK